MKTVAPGHRNLLVNDETPVGALGFENITDPGNVYYYSNRMSNLWINIVFYLK